MAPHEFIEASLSTHPFAFLFSTLLFGAIATAILAQVSTWRYPVEIARVREPEGKRTFSLRTRLAYYTDAKELFREAYEKVCPCLPQVNGCSNKL
jgi:hypothetical protein